MDLTYFEDTYHPALEQAQTCLVLAEEAQALFRSVNYQSPDLISPKAVHAALVAAMTSVELARYQFEKARWAATDSTVTLAEWLQQNDCADLIRFSN